MAKGLARKITRKQARSYARTSPNGLGVTHIASVNGRPHFGSGTSLNGKGAYKKHKASKRRPNGLIALAGTGTYLNGRGAKAKAVFGGVPKSWYSPKKKLTKTQRSELRAKQRPGDAMKRRYKKTKAILSKKTSGAAMKRRKRNGPAKDLNKLFEGQMKAARAKKRKTAKRKAPLTGAAFKARMAAGKRKAAAKRRKSTRKPARRAGGRVGPFKTVGARIGIRKVATYGYLKGKGKKRKLKHVPLWASVGAKSARDLKKRMGSDARLASRVEKAKKRRARAAARVEAHGDLFTPNRKRAPKRVIPFEQWSENMKPNRRRKGKKLTGAAKKKFLARMAKGRRKASGAPKRTRRAAAKRRAAPKRKRSVGKRTRRVSAKRRAAPKRRHAKKVVRGAAKRTRRAATAVRRRRARRAVRTLKLYVGNRRRRTHRRRYDANAVAATPNRRRRHARRRYDENKRRTHRRHYRRNPDFMAKLKGALKIGAVVTAGFLAHRAVSHVISNQLGSMSTFQSGSAADYKGLLAGAIAAVGGLALVPMFAPGGDVGALTAGIFASFLAGAAVTLLNKAGASGQNVASYLGGYPDQSGPAYRGYGEYVMAGYGGMGEYMAVNGYGAMPQITQAAAGYGYGGNPMLTQAAAGYGGPLMQAAAGVGEYIATSGLQGYGEYELTGASGVGDPGGVNEGVYPDLTSAEHALTIAEAAAGMGDLGFKSQVTPPFQAQAISDAPTGARSGILQGGDGIFG